MDSKCSICGVHVCETNSDANLPQFCPMEDQELYKEAVAIINSDEYKEFYQNSCLIERDGYTVWPRVKEILVFIKRMKFKKVGLAFCGGFIPEAKILTKIYKENGVDLISAICKTGAIDKSTVLSEEEKLSPGEYEPICNPVAQAMILNKAETEFNIIMGLCVGHDSLFTKFSKALCTTVVVKDRVTGNNPCVALYCADGYFKNRLNYNGE
ncbi:Hypothetical protein ING2D1G_0389 [Peptoniphilus sp. ING2-D1G]|nr:Hypothetical protein ING2D1G_0389 [Peptoniphilus sp. ING2-D1G]